MELLEGDSLDALVAVDGAQPPERVLHVLDGVAGALEEAHGVGLIHRDIKPANIILCKQGGAFDALGAVGYFLLTGSHVFPGSNLIEVRGRHLHTKAERPSARLGRTTEGRA